MAGMYGYAEIKKAVNAGFSGSGVKITENEATSTHSMTLVHQILTESKVATKKPDPAITKEFKITWSKQYIFSQSTHFQQVVARLVEEQTKKNPEYKFPEHAVDTMKVCLVPKKKTGKAAVTQVDPMAKKAKASHKPAFLEDEDEDQDSDEDEAMPLESLARSYACMLCVVLRYHKYFLAMIVSQKSSRKSKYSRIGR